MVNEEDAYKKHAGQFKNEADLEEELDEAQIDREEAEKEFFDSKEKDILESAKKKTDAVEQEEER